ncbi:MAG TPA: hypothetical protein VIV12_27495 [Streptosporangiaceae bacterium]
MAIVNPTPKQARNLRDLPAGPGPVSSADVGEVERAMAASMGNSAARSAETRQWLEAPLANPAVSGDRVTARPGESGYVGPVLGVGQHPGAEPPAMVAVERQPQRLPPLPEPPAPVTSSTVRPAYETGFWHRPLQQPDGTLVYVSADAPARRSGGLLSRLARWLRGGGSQ